MMRTLRSALVIIAALLSGPTLALDDASIPTKFPIPWGQSAGGAYIRNIPEASQIGITNGAASLTTGFPPLTFLPVGAGGVPPFGQDFNGILKQITQWSRWQAAGGPVFYDSSFSTSISGYPKGALLAATSFGSYWLSSADNNTSDPDAGGANWVGFIMGNLYAVDSGAVNAITITIGQTPASLTSLIGVPINVKVANANTSTAPTLTVNTFAAKTIINSDGTALVEGQIPLNGIATFKYDGTNFQLAGLTGNIKAPTYLSLTSGSGTLTIASAAPGAKRMLILMVGGGGGGGGTGSTGGSDGSAGGDSSFGSTTAKGGAGGAHGVTGTQATGALGGAGGSGGTTGTGSEVWRQAGQAGGQATSTVLQASSAGTGWGLSGAGGNSVLGGGGQPSWAVAGKNAVANTGSGSSGASMATNDGSNYASPGGGGAAGEAVEFEISSLSATYAYVVGTPGSGGAGSGTGSSAGGTPAAGVIRIKFTYNQ